MAKICENCGSKTKTLKVVYKNKESYFCNENCLYDFLKNCKGAIRYI